MDTIVKIFMVAILITGCASRLPSLVGGRASNPKGAVQEGSLNGQVLDLKGAPVNLADLSTTAYVVIFSAESCASCRQETQELLDLFSAKGGVPTNVKILTVLIGSDIEGAQLWAQSFDHPIPWTVTVDSNLEVYFQFFAEIQTPALMASSGGATFQKFIGPQSLSTLEEVTGKWQF